MKFTKMHGLGNDYVYVDCFKEKVNQPAELAKAVSDRHTGIGADGLILIEPSQRADVRMRMYNADGTEAEMCGNGIRCVGKYSYEYGLAASSGPLGLPGHDTTDFNESMTIETGHGVLTVGLHTDSQDKVTDVCVNMGEPLLTPAQIPVLLSGSRVVNSPIDVPAPPGGTNQTFLMTCVSMGNPHAVIFVENVSAIDLEQLGPLIETHSLFPRRTNVHFVQVLSATEFQVRTWERGSGITLACGTGACACCVAAVLTEKSRRSCRAHLPGGTLKVVWCEQDNHVYMTGPAVEVFQGQWPQ